MRDYNMKQCILSKTTNQGKSFIITWIPTDYAQLGRAVKVKEANVWIDGWTVCNVYHLTKKSSEVIRDRDHYRNQRKASDMIRR